MIIRVLVTGSRDWTDYERLVGALLEQDPCAEHGECNPGCPTITVVHGACAIGADALADGFARAWGVRVESHPADWERHGKRAGYVRNAEMVALGADVCLAFIMPCRRADCPDGPAVHDSHGAAMTARLAETAGIPVRRIRP